MVIPPCITPPDFGNLLASDVVIVAEKFASSPRAAANSFKVFNAVGALSFKLAMAVVT